MRILFRGSNKSEVNNWLASQLFELCVDHEEDEILWQMSVKGILMNTKTARPFISRKQLADFIKKYRKSV